MTAPLVAFDVESSGVDVETDRIVTATVATIRGGIVDLRQWLADPGVDIPEGATAIHGITTGYAREHGSRPDKVVAEVGHALRDGWAAGGVVVGFNISYDFSILDREMRRHLDHAFSIIGPVVDPFVLDKHFDKYRKGSRKLTAVAEHYRVKLDGAHDATEDALAAARVWWRLRRVYPELADMSWRDLWRLQVHAKAEQAAGLQGHLRAKARDSGASVAEVEAIVVDPHWPIAPLPTAAAVETGVTP